MAKGLRLKPIPWLQRTGLTRERPMRTVKLIRPRCDDCQNRLRGWWASCTHSPAPYHGFQAITADAPKVFDPESGEWRQEVEQKILGYRLIPNVVQAPLTIRVDSGLSVEMMFAKGCRTPENVQPLLEDGTPDPEHDGYAPMCQFENCYQKFPTVRATHSLLTENRQVPEAWHTGWYCSETHARIAKRRDSGKARLVSVMQVPGMSVAEEIAAVPLP